MILEYEDYEVKMKFSYDELNELLAWAEGKSKEKNNRILYKKIICGLAEIEDQNNKPEK